MNAAENDGPNYETETQKKVEQYCIVKSCRKPIRKNEGRYATIQGGAYCQNCWEVAHVQS